jgi:hypothetical protein
MTKKYNNDSLHFKDWTTQKLKKQAISYYQIIYEIESYSTRDLMVYQKICDELEKRGVEIKTGIYFD